LLYTSKNYKNEVDFILRRIKQHKIDEKILIDVACGSGNHSKIFQKKGYKIYNHECYCAFLKEIAGKSDIGDEFNSFRKLRNSINYYGKDISAEEANPVLKDMSKLIEKVKKLL